MKQYFTNLMAALKGKNPCQEEIGKMNEECKKMAEKVETLGKAHDELLKSMCMSEVQLKAYEKSLTTSEEQLKSLQTLVENLRERLAEKDAMLSRMQEDYRRQEESYEKRVGDYGATIARLQKEIEDHADKEDLHARGKKRPKTRKRKTIQESETKQKADL